MLLTRVTVTSERIRPFVHSPWLGPCIWWELQTSIDREPTRWKLLFCQHGKGSKGLHAEGKETPKETKGEGVICPASVVWPLVGVSKAWASGHHTLLNKPLSGRFMIEIRENHVKKANVLVSQGILPLLWVLVTFLWGLILLFPQALQDSGIHIFASQLHTHLTGRKVVTVLARDGQERKVVNRDNHYSPHFQVMTCLSPASKAFCFPGLTSDLR